MTDFGIPVPRGGVASTPAEARKVAEKLGGPVVVKAQAQAGGRGQAGGIKTAPSPDTVEALAAAMLGTRLVTHQTPPEGVPVTSVLVEEAVASRQELYLGLTIDSSLGLPTMIASEAGGMEIEEVASSHPEQVLKVAIDPVAGFQPFLGRQLAYGMNLDAGLVRPMVELMANLYRLFQAHDASLVEINPLVVTEEGKLLALDAKINFDDNALFRHADLESLRDPGQESALELQALDLGLKNYVKLDGNVACMVNGAGLAMAALDVITLAGGEPANFLDIGTMNNTDRVVNAFRLFLSDPNVKAVMVNIFGGMARADIIAQGIVEAYRDLDIKLPVVVRLAGTNVEEGDRILADSGLDVIRAATLQEAAERAVAAAREVS